MRKYLEAFFDYYSGWLECMKQNIDNFAIYVNPTKHELKYSIPLDARGYIDPKGNLYLEGFLEPKYVSSEDFRSKVIHADLLNILADKITISSKLLNPAGNFIYYLPSADTFGVCIQRVEDEIVLAESYDKNDYNISLKKLFSKASELFELAQKKNSQLVFNVI